LRFLRGIRLLPPRAGMMATQLTTSPPPPDDTS
jgi:hypothetical protein